ncbi:Uncharacterised protein [uncultured archaeon]|nr:Uncharacterised protein [uncultured archaeon]
MLKIAEKETKQDKREGNPFPKKDIMECRAAITAKEVRACLWRAIGEAGQQWFAQRKMPEFPKWNVSGAKNGDAAYAHWTMDGIGMSEIIRFANGSGNAEKAIAAIELFKLSYPHAGTSTKYIIQESYALSALALACFQFTRAGNADAAERTIRAANAIRSKELDPYHMQIVQDTMKSVPPAFFSAMAIASSAKG